MGDNWLILVGILGVALLGLMPSLIARITGRNVQVRTRTGSFTTQPFRTKKERQKEDEQDILLKELNAFCIEVSYMDFDKYSTELNVQLFNSNGRPMLTQRALNIVNAGKVGEALTGYRKLNKLKESQEINSDEYCEQATNLYNYCIT